MSTQAQQVPVIPVVLFEEPEPRTVGFHPRKDGEATGRTPLDPTKIVWFEESNLTPRHTEFGRDVLLRWGSNQISDHWVWPDSFEIGQVNERRAHELQVARLYAECVLCWIFFALDKSDSDETCLINSIPGVYQYESCNYRLALVSPRSIKLKEAAPLIVAMPDTGIAALTMRVIVTYWHDKAIERIKEGFGRQMNGAEVESRIPSRP